MPILLGEAVGTIECACAVWGCRESEKKVKQPVTDVYIPAINQSAARGPVKLELTRAVGDWVSVKSQGLVSGVRRSKLDEAVSSIADAIVSFRLCAGDLTWRLLLQTYPEFLSRMTLTLTVSPAEERKTPLMKFSSIQGSSSPIQRVVLDWSGEPPEGGGTDKSCAGGVPFWKDISKNKSSRKNRYRSIQNVKDLYAKSARENDASRTLESKEIEKD